MGLLMRRHPNRYQTASSADAVTEDGGKAAAPDATPSTTVKAKRASKKGAAAKRS